jgi:hypothetical protein
MTAMTPSPLRRFARIAALCLVFYLCSCSDGDDHATPTEQQPSVVTDPVRTSAHALFDYVQSISNQEYADAEAYFVLVYTETAKQKVWMDFIQNMELPNNRFGKACQARFGELPLLRGGIVWKIASFRWQKEDADRAVIECVNDHGVKWPLHLVKVGDQWWISGYTFEYGNNGFDQPGFERLGRTMPGIGSYIDAVAVRVRNGEFATLKEAEKALEAAISKWGDDHPDLTR